MPDRWEIAVEPPRWSTRDMTAEVRLDGYEPDPRRPYLRVAEIDVTGDVVDHDVACQLDQVDDAAMAVFLLKGKTAAGNRRAYRIWQSERKPACEALVELRQNVAWQEQESYQITTPMARFLYHIRGAGFASLIDRDGNDWLSYRPYGGSDGVYRGIPNLAHPENHFHPGGKGCRSRIVNDGPLKVTIASESLDGKWACRWEIYPTHARLTALKVDHAYWFLYEGTPGGALDEAGDYCVTSDGRRRPLSESWATPIPEPEWIYFGASNSERALFLAHHEADDHIDSYWPMEGNMTVFGFGRNGLEKYMTRTPAQFTIGLAETSDFNALRKLIGAVTQSMCITPVEPRKPAP